MSKFNEVKAAALKRLEDKKANLDIQLAILELVPESLVDRVEVMASQLYGSIAGIYLDHNFFDYAGTDKQPTYADIRELAKAFPPVRIVKVCDGCKSFRPAETLQTTYTEEQLDKVDTEDVAPYIVCVEQEPTQWRHQTMTIQWYSKTPKGLVRLQVKLPLSYRLGTLTVEYGKNNQYRHVKKCEFAPNWNTIGQLGDCEQGYKTQLQPPKRYKTQLQGAIRWASGGPEYANKFTLYWVDYYEDANASTITDLITALEPTQDELREQGARQREQHVDIS
jgi:hypothetical protein